MWVKGQWSSGMKVITNTIYLLSSQERQECGRLEGFEFLSENKGLEKIDFTDDF